MSSPQPDDLYIAPRSKRSVGLGGAVLRALVVMAALDVALLLAAIDADSPAVSAGTREVPAMPARVDAAPPVEAVPPAGARPPSPAPADKAAHKEPAAATPVPAPPSGAESRGPAAAGVLAERPPASEPAALVPRANAIPAVVTLPNPPPEAPRVVEPAVVLPTAKPSPPALPPKPAARHGAPQTQHRRQVAPLREEIVATAAPRGLETAERRAEPPPCKPYTAQTTLTGERLPVRGIACPEPDGGWRIVTERASLD